MRYNKGVVHLLLLLVVAFVAVFGIGYYAYQNGQIIIPVHEQSKNPTNLANSKNMHGWEKCVNYDVNIEFECPENWSKSNPSINYPQYYLYKAVYDSSLEISVKYYYGLNQDSKIPLTFEDYVKDKTALGIEINDINFSGHQAKIIVESNNRTLSLPYPTYNKGHAKIFEISNKTPSSDLNDAAFDRIIDSLTFIDPLNENDWKTYRDESLGIEYEYRPDLLINSNPEKDSIQITNNSASYNVIDYDFMFRTNISKINLNGLEPIDFAFQNLCGTETQDEFWSKMRKLCRDGINNTFSKYNNKNINGWEFYYNPYENTVYAIIFPSSNGKKYFMLSSSTETGGDGPTEMGLKTINQILSTFEFIE